jgi:hypothetical protein
MHVKRQLGQIKRKALKSMVNGEDEIIFLVERKNNKCIFFFVLP